MNKSLLKKGILIAVILACVVLAVKAFKNNVVSAEERLKTIVFSEFTDMDGNVFEKSESDALILLTKSGNLDGIAMEEEKVDYSEGTVSYKIMSKVLDFKTMDITMPVLFKEEKSIEDKNYGLDETDGNLLFSAYVSNYITYEDEGREFVIIQAISKNGEEIPSAFTLEVDGKRFPMATRDISFNINGDYSDTCIMFYGINYEELAEGEVRICVTDIMRKYSGTAYEIID